MGKNSQVKIKKIEKFNRENYQTVTFRLRKTLDKTAIECLDELPSKNSFLRKAVIDALLKYECSSLDVYEELIDLREKLKIELVICKGWDSPHRFIPLLRYYNNGVLSVNGLNIMLNEYGYGYDEFFDDPSCKESDEFEYDADNITSDLEGKLAKLRKDGYNNNDILSAIVWMRENESILDDELEVWAKFILGDFGLTYDDLINFKRYFNYGELSGYSNDKVATTKGIVKVYKNDD